MKILSVLKNVVLALVGLFLLCLIVLVGANWSDEQLSPAAEALSRIPAPRVDDAANAYYVFVGMSAPKDADAAATGRKIQAVYDRLYKEDPLRDKYESPDLPKDPMLGGDKALAKLRCGMQGGPCVSLFTENAALVREQIAANGLLLGRYAELRQLPNFEEKLIPTPYAPLPQYQPLMRASDLILGGAVLAAGDGRDDEALAAITGEITLHRHLLADTSALISRMISVAMLRRDYQVLSELIESKPTLAQAHWDAVKPLLAPLSERENDMRPPFAAEARFVASLTQSMPEVLKRGGSDFDLSGGLSRLRGARFFYLPNATTNSALQHWGALVELAHGSPADYERRKQQFDQAEAAAQSQAAPDWTWVRNPVGKIILTIDPPNLSVYVERVHDLDGYIRLVALQAALRHDQVARDAVAAYAAKAPPEMRNPYNGNPFQWDAATSTLSFTGKTNSNANPGKDPKVHRIVLSGP